MSLENSDEPVGKGQRGELTIRGPQVMQGYWNKPDETTKSLRNGRFYTGDVATCDEQGYFFIVDRIKDMIIASGYKIYPRNVEEAIYQHESVAECVVAGVPDDYRGQTVKAYIKLKDGAKLSEDDLIAFLKDKLSTLEIPKHVEFRDSLPKTMIGKLDRKALIKEEAERKK
jgi:long-chain acyl-CoA synthetase